MIFMIKGVIKKRMKKTGMVRELEMKNDKLESRVNDLEKQKLILNDKLESRVNDLEKQKLILAADKLRKKYKYLNSDKLDLIDVAFQNIIPNAQSFADLGGVWGVNGGYTFYTLDKHNIKSAFLVDVTFNDEVNDKSIEYENLTLLNSEFGDDELIKQLGHLDVIFLFDVLLHQVKPDWDEILEKYSSICDCMVIFNQQFTNSEDTIRLFDLGYDKYFENIPHNENEPTYKMVFEKMYENHPNYQNRIWRDIQNVFQWGIVDKDLYLKIKDLGFSLEFYQNVGQFLDLKNFENHMFIFKKNKP